MNLSTTGSPLIDADIATKSCALALKVVDPWPVHEIGAGADLGLGSNDIFAQAKVSSRIFEAFCILLPQNQSTASVPDDPSGFVAVASQPDYTGSSSTMRVMCA